MSKTSTAHLLDPELAAFASDENPLVNALRAMETAPKDNAALLSERERINAIFAMAQADPSRFKVTREEVFVPNGNGPDVRCLLYIPDENAASRPGYLHMHGGGYLYGKPEMCDMMNYRCADALGVVVCSVDYRMGPEAPTPTPLEDCYSVLSWFQQNAAQWNIDTNRIAVGGESAGGGMAAALSIVARDRGEYSICHQHLTSAMLDSRTGSQDFPGDPLTGEFVWSRESNQFAWNCHLGDVEATAPYVPALLEDFSGLPNAWISTSGLDLFRDENIAYANNLMKAGVSTELSVVPGGPHGYEVIPKTKIGKRFFQSHLNGLAKALGVEF